MKNKHYIDMEIECQCPLRSCGATFTKKAKLVYYTNNRGDVIEYKVI